MAECGGALGHVLWRVASDVLLWGAARQGVRGTLFHPADASEAEPLSIAGTSHPELEDALTVLWSVHESAGAVNAPAVGNACSAVAAWAEGAALKRTAVQIAELAARLLPDSSELSFVAGRLCRRSGEFQRAAIWYRRALRLGRLADDLIDVANARLGMGNLESDLGNLRAAEENFWKAARAALRNGRRSLAAAAFHNLVGVTYDSGRRSEALEHLKRAAECYRPDHPRFPAFAYDAGFFLMREGYFSSALLLHEAVLPRVEGQRVSVLVRSALARSAAAVKDNIRYTRQSRVVLEMVAADDEDAASALCQLAEGARSFQNWAGAESFARQALALATRRGEARVVNDAEALLRAIEQRIPGDIDLVPPEDDPVDLATRAVLHKLGRKPASRAGEGGVIPPERYPTE